MNDINPTIEHDLGDPLNINSTERLSRVLHGVLEVRGIDAKRAKNGVAEFSQDYQDQLLGARVRADLSKYTKDDLRQLADRLLGLCQLPQDQAERRAELIKEIKEQQNIVATVGVFLASCGSCPLEESKCGEYKESIKKLEDAAARVSCAASELSSLQ